VKALAVATTSDVAVARPVDWCGMQQKQGVCTCRGIGAASASRVALCTLRSIAATGMGPAYSESPGASTFDCMVSISVVWGVSAKLTGRREATSSSRRAARALTELQRVAAAIVEDRSVEMSASRDLLLRDFFFFNLRVFIKE